jgi:hypothetical protein
MRSRAIAFALVVAACVLLGGGWVLAASLRSDSTTSDARVRVANAPKPVRAAPLAPVAAARALMVRAVDPRDDRLNGRLTRVKLGEATGGQAGKLACQRVYFAAGRGLCLALESSGVDYSARIFDDDMVVRHEFRLEGLPSRARVSPGGRFGSFTTFVSGDSYAEPGAFSTRTKIVDMRTGRQVADLEQFTVIKDGEKIDSPDFNFWGVTFARDEDRFYATLSTGGERYLVEGSLRDRRVTVLRENVECPSLSPDGTRLAYKKRVGGPEDWRLHVLDLATMRDVPLAERRSIDDQAEWLDDDTVVYGDGHAVWAARADGGGRPRRLLARASSPVRLP